MKTVLISIQPKWCELIASGEKLVEVRKTKPKIETPFKCYIYCTQNGKNLIKDDISTTISFIAKNSGKVIGEFVCDRIHNIKLEEDFESGASSWECGYYAEEDCLSMEEFEAYLKKGFGFGWHISDLVIYDKPKALSEFKKYCNGVCVDTKIQKKCQRILVDGFSCDGLLPITRPPQSWCYVEEIEVREMNEYIKKSEAVDVIVKYPYEIAGKTATAIKMIEDLPSADVVPRSTIKEIFALIWDAFQSTYYDSEFEEKFDKIEKKYIGE